MLLANKWQTPDGKILQSTNRHHYVSHLDANGKVYAVDGGISYCRLVGDSADLKNLCVYSEDDHELIRENFMWGTRGKSGQNMLKYKPLKELETEHIEAILATQHQIVIELRGLFIYELCYREDQLKTLCSCI